MGAVVTLDDGRDASAGLRIGDAVGQRRSALVPFGTVAAVAIAAVAAFRSFAPEAGLPGFPLDDSWIHMVYARSLVEEGTLGYNPGVAATGATSPLWVALLALLRLLTGDDPTVLVTGAHVLGAGFHVAAALLATWSVGELTRRRLPAATAGVLVAVSPPLLAASQSGMEVSLAAALLLAAHVALARRAWVGCGVLAAMAIAARPEAACVVALLAAAAAALAGGRPLRAAARVGIPVAVLLAGWAAWSVAATGRPLPATFYMKLAVTGGGGLERVGWAVDRLQQASPFVSGLAVLLLAAVPWVPRRAESLLPLLSGLVFVAGNSMVIASPDPWAFYHLRYLLPAVPLLVAGLAVAAAAVGRRGWGAAALLVLGLAESAATFADRARHHYNDVRNIDEVQRAIGHWLHEHVPPGAWIAASDAGAIRYFSERPTIDVMGLNTPELYWQERGWVAERPVAALAMMVPGWFSPQTPGSLRIVFVAETANYTVTSEPLMSRQVVYGCRGHGAVPVGFGGRRNVALICDPALLRTSPTASDSAPPTLPR